MWATWWIWMVAGLSLAFLEVLVPSYIFLGFALGAFLTGLAVWTGGPLAFWLASSLPVTLLFFAVLSLVSWLVLRRVMGVRKGQVKVWDRDINED